MDLLGNESNTLSAARNLIGQVLKASGTSTVTQTFSVIEATPRGIFNTDKLAHTVLKTTLFEAAFVTTHTNGFITGRRRLESSEALAFVSGTGLNIMIERWGLAYDADTLRELFYEKLQART